MNYLPLTDGVMMDSEHKYLKQILTNGGIHSEFFITYSYIFKVYGAVQMKVWFLEYREKSDYVHTWLKKNSDTIWI